MTPQRGCKLTLVLDGISICVLMRRKALPQTLIDYAISWKRNIPLEQILGIYLSDKLEISYQRRYCKPVDALISVASHVVVVFVVVDLLSFGDNYTTVTGSRNSWHASITQQFDCSISRPSDFPHAAAPLDWYNFNWLFHHQHHDTDQWLDGIQPLPRVFLQLSNRQIFLHIMCSLARLQQYIHQ